MAKIPTSLLPRRSTSLLTSSCRPTTTGASAQTNHPIQSSQVRHATKIHRPRRPYQFTQLVQLSDGSTYTVRTTSPMALYKSTKDSRNHLMWQPTEKSLRNLEVDEAGKLAAFRERFGRSWDVADAPGEEDAAASPASGQNIEAAEPAKAEDPIDILGDLISGYAANDPNVKAGGMSAKDQARADKTKKKK